MMNLSQTISRKATSGYRAYIREWEEFAEDVAGELLAQWYALSDFDRPKTLKECELWMYERAMSVRKEKRFRDLGIDTSKVNDGLKRRAGYLGGKANNQDQDALDFLSARRTGMFAHSEQPVQFSAVFCRQILDQIDTLPFDKRKFVYEFLDQGDVIDYARVNGVSLFDAMDALKHAKTIMKRLAEDMADERKFAPEDAQR